jgi:group II intron reverse transcriptase/maturase
MELNGGTMSGAPNPGSISTKLEQIAKRAKEMPGVAFNTLAHHIDIEWLREAYRRTRKDGAVGVDGQTAEEYAAKLEENLRSLLDRAKSGDHYRAPPVRRVHIPKGDGSKTRPIGIPTFEDKVLQRAVAMVLEAVYEQDFYNCSYGFRPGRSAHDALRALREPLMEMNGGWVLEADIEKFFDSVDRAQLQELLRRRVRDGVLHRLIGKWLNAGVMEEGRVYRPEAGTPQGGVISPLLANIYLHEVLDGWFAREVKPRLRGRAHLVRYADDFVIAFEQEDVARRVMDVLPKRFGKYGLRLHPEKTRLVRFNRPSRSAPPRDDAAEPESFDLLGFTHYWRRSRQGNWVVYRKTARSRLSRALRATSLWLRRNRHEPIKEQHRVLVLKLRGHYSYYGIIGNFAAMDSFRSWARALWCKWLSRRSRASPGPTAMGVTLDAYPLPRPRITHAV